MQENSSRMISNSIESDNQISRNRKKNSKYRKKKKRRRKHHSRRRISKSPDDYAINEISYYDVSPRQRQSYLDNKLKLDYERMTPQVLLARLSRHVENRNVSLLSQQFNESLINSLSDSPFNLESSIIHDGNSTGMIQLGGLRNSTILNHQRILSNQTQKYQKTKGYRFRRRRLRRRKKISSF